MNKAFIIGFTSLFFLFFSAETFFRWHRSSGQPDAAYLLFLLENSKPFFAETKEDGTPWLIQQPTLQKNAQLQKKFRRDKDNGIFRILVLGESSAEGLAGELNQWFSQHGLSKKFEIMDCAVSGGSLEMVENRFNEAIHYSPDIVVFLFGHNLFYNHPTLRRWGYLLALISPYSQFAANLAARMPDRKADPFRNEQGRLVVFQKALERMALKTRSKKIPLVICTVPSNLRSAPTVSISDRTDLEYLKANYFYLIGAHQKACQTLSQRLHAKSVAWWHFRLGDWFYRHKNYPLARRHLILARDLDLARMRATSSINALIRDVARKNHLWLMDTSNLLDKSVPHGIPGWESFGDAQHVVKNVNIRQTHALLAILKANGWPNKNIHLNNNDWQKSKRSQYALDAKFFYRALEWRTTESAKISLVLAIEAELSKLPDLDKGIKDISIRLSMISADPLKKSRVLLAFAEALWLLGRSEAAFKLNDAAARLSPGWEEIFFQRGIFYLSLHRFKEAATSFVQTLKLSPGRIDAKHFLRWTWRCLRLP